MKGKVEAINDSVKGRKVIQELNPKVHILQAKEIIITHLSIYMLYS